MEGETHLTLEKKEPIAASHPSMKAKHTCTRSTEWMCTGNYRRL